MTTRLLKRLLGIVPLAIAVWAAEAPSQTPAAPVPQGYTLVYEQHFDAGDALRQFVFSDPQAWKFSADGASFTLELAKQSNYEPKARSPFNIALIADRIFGDFVLEADLIQTGQEYGHRDMCIFFGVQDPARFYYTHMATKTDDHAHNIFIVNQAPRAKISNRTTPGVNWGLGIWHRVRVERQKGKVAVFFDDMKEPIMSAEDQTFGAGWIGFGSFDDTGRIDNIRIWAPSEPERKSASFFGTAP